MMPPLRHFGALSARLKLSLWLCFITLVPAATMMHPSFAALFAIFSIGVLVFVIRLLARLEGAASEAESDRHGD